MTNVTRLKPAVQQHRGLRSDVQVCIFGNERTTGDRNDIDRDLSDKGKLIAQRVGVLLDTARPRTVDTDKTGCFDYVLCSGAVRAQKTVDASVHHYGERYNCFARGLYAPKNEADFTAMCDALRETYSLIASKHQHAEPETAYAVFKLQDVTHFLARFMAETREVVFSRPGIADARRIAIFSHEIMGNAVGEALFPQHSRKLETIRLCHGDCVILTNEECKHYPLMPQFG